MLGWGGLVAAAWLAAGWVLFRYDAYTDYRRGDHDWAALVSRAQTTLFGGNAPSPLALQEREDLLTRWQRSCQLRHAGPATVWMRPPASGALAVAAWSPLPLDAREGLRWDLQPALAGRTTLSLLNEGRPLWRLALAGSPRVKPAVSGEAAKLAFCHLDRLWLASLDGGEIAEAARLPMARQGGELRFSADGTLLGFREHPKAAWQVLELQPGFKGSLPSQWVALPAQPGS